MLKKVITTTAFATVLLTSSISANELSTQGFNSSPSKVETIGAFDNIPSEDLNSNELKTSGEWYFSLNLRKWISIDIGSGHKYRQR